MVHATVHLNFPLLTQTLRTTSRTGMTVSGNGIAVRHHSNFVSLDSHDQQICTALPYETSIIDESSMAGKSSRSTRILLCCFAYTFRIINNCISKIGPSVPGGISIPNSHFYRQKSTTSPAPIIQRNIRYHHSTSLVSVFLIESIYCTYTKWDKTAADYNNNRRQW